MRKRRIEPCKKNESNNTTNGGETSPGFLPLHGDGSERRWRMKAAGGGENESFTATDANGDGGNEEECEEKYEEGRGALGQLDLLCSASCLRLPAPALVVVMDLAAIFSQ
ncbi:hypothetical protein Droror1_Dr00016050 [Drosera rotundifolia]